MSENYVPHLYLYSGLSQDQVSNMVKEFCIEEEKKNIDTILQEWLIAVQALRQVEQQDAGVSNNAVTHDLPDNPKLNQIQDNSLFKNTFSKLPYEFKYIDIENLIAYQRQVSLEHVANLEKKIPDKPTEDELIDICIPPEVDMPIPKTMKTAQNAWTFTSPAQDFRFVGAFLKEKITDDDIKYTDVSAVPSHAITLFVGYGGPTINVIQANNRLILNNGFHRVYTFYKKGITRIPVVVQKVGNVDIDFPPHLVPQTNYLLKHPRPVVVKDFFNSNLVRVFKQKRLTRTVTITFGAQQTDIDI